MAIIQLSRYKSQPPVTATGKDITINELWCLVVDVDMRPPKALSTVSSLGSGNIYDFPMISEKNIDISSALVSSYNVSQKDANSYKVFEITVTYTNDSQTINSTTDPVLAGPDISYDIVEAEIVVDVDQKTGGAIQNSAGKPIIVTETESLIRCTIVRNESDYSAKRAMVYSGTVNSGSVTLVGESFAAETCKLERWTGASQYDSDGRLYWRVTYQILIRNDGFKRKLIDKGFVDINGRTPAEIKGFSSNEEYKLNGAGKFLSAADQSNPNEFEPLEFNTLRVTNWGPPTRLGRNPPSDINDLVGPANDPLGLTT